LLFECRRDVESCIVFAGVEPRIMGASCGIERVEYCCPCKSVIVDFPRWGS
jgi:hypothetical protein